MDYLEKIDEFIKDEKKIVSYRWLSITLKVSSNTAKQMLYHYYDNNKNDSSDTQITATYFISGVKFDKDLQLDVQKMTVVQDEDLEKAKAQFKQIFCTHVYSIQETQMKDLEILYGVDYDIIRNNINESNKFSSIACTSDNFQSREVDRQIPKNTDSQQRKTEAMVKKEINDVENKENQLTTNSTKSGKLDSNSTKSGAVKSTKGAIASMFANQKKQSEKTKPDNKTTQSSSSKSAPKKNPLANFLTKGQPMKPISPKKEIHRLVSPKKEDKLVSPKKETFEHVSPKKEKFEQVSPKKEKFEQVSPQKETSRRVSPRKRSMTNSDVYIEENTKGNSKNKSTKKKSVQASRKNTKSNKVKRKSSDAESNSKRRRIVQPFDSSSESNDEEDDILDECPIPSPIKPAPAISSDDDDIIPPTPTSQNDAHDGVLKRKRRKLVDKTYLDEDGFLVTKKEYELVSESDEEDPIPTPKSGGKSSPPKSAPKPPQKEKKSPVKTKQSTLMNFFKKK